MNQVEIDGKTYFTPSDWNELTKKTGFVCQPPVSGTAHHGGF